MPIIKYTLVNGQAPSGITDGGWFRNRADNTLIGIGSGVGTELTKAELITRMQEMGGKYLEMNQGAEDLMMGAPSKISNDQLSEIGLRVLKRQ